jgi:hypothetical protein
MNGEYDQIPPRVAYFLTIVNTAWIYPMSDLQYVLDRTTIPYTFDGTFLVVDNLANLVLLYGEVYNRTAVTQPVGNPGYSLGVGTQLEDMGNEIIWQVQDGLQVIRWRLMRQLTPQLPATVIPAPGNSPNGTIGYGTTWVAYGNYPSLDEVMFVRVG